MTPFKLLGLGLILLMITLGAPTVGGVCDPRSIPEWNIILLSWEIVSKLEELGIYEWTLISVTTDHGFDEGKTRHGRAPEIWMVTNDPRVAPPEGHRATQADIVLTLQGRFGFDLDSIEPSLPGRSLRARSFGGILCCLGRGGLAQ